MSGPFDMSNSGCIARAACVKWSAVLIAMLAATTSAQTGFARSGERSWTHLGGSSRRHSLVSLPCAPSTTPTWVRATDIGGHPITFVGQAGLAVYAGDGVEDGLVFATGRISPPGQPANQHRLFAFARSNGAVRWQSQVATPVLDSFSSPALDEVNRVVIHASGRRVQAFRMDTGMLAWDRSLTNFIVNASPMVTSDRGPADRVFITDYDGFGGSSRLYCINADPFDPARNPYQPGEILWSYPIGSSSGNSVSYLPADMGGESLVYVATVGPDPGFAPGRIYAFPISDTIPSPRWTYENEIPEGYFGGVCVVPPDPFEPPGQPPILYAATYAFCSSCGSDSASLVKVNARTGEEIWTVPSNRTQSIPIPLPGGRVALSAGIQGFGTVPNVQMFEDLGASAQLVWDTTIGLFNLGGWTHQPIAAQFGGYDVLAVGVPPADFTQVSPEMLIVNLASDPSREDFVLRHYAGSGGSPAIVGSALYSVGTLGLVALGPSPRQLDVNGDGSLGIADLYAWENGTGNRDVNNDGTITGQDRLDLLSFLRAPEAAMMTGGRE